MLNTTLTKVETVLHADTTIPAEHRDRILRELRRERGTDRLLTTREACVALDPGHPVHPATLRRYERRGLLHAVRTSARRRRWRESELVTLRDGGRG
jgi:hypothetical protein